ncbi:hypothetical protein GCM10010448_66430 [Streptomyces glomeratus]|uniref:Uncharacterized protein n=1 Tax=Streptomyces glomeratus TaxID=284452 RepID=A0ABP6M3B5_9ACTN
MTSDLSQTRHRLVTQPTENGLDAQVSTGVSTEAQNGQQPVDDSGSKCHQAVLSGDPTAAVLIAEGVYERVDDVWHGPSAGVLSVCFLEVDGPDAGSGSRLGDA